MRGSFMACVVVAFATVAGTDMFGANGNFVPDWTFKGSALTEWQAMGQADWGRRPARLLAHRARLRAVGWYGTSRFKTSRWRPPFALLPPASPACSSARRRLLGGSRASF